MAAKKLTTEEILARARAQVGSGSGSTPSADDASSAPEPAADSPAAESEAAEPAASPSEDTPAAAGKKTPASTADILAMARAQKKGGAAAKPAAASTEKPAAAKPAESGKTPTSTSDILARARAQAKGGAAPAAAKPAAAAAKPAAKKPAAARATGERPTVAEMVKAVRSDAPAPAAKPAGPVTPPLPSRRPPVVQKKEPQQSRRGFLRSTVGLLASPFAAAWILFSGATMAATLGLARYMMPNVLVEPPTTFKIGPPGDYPPGVVSTKWKAQFGIWVVRTVYEGETIIYALSTVCTHLGCTPNWLEGEQKFKCPCHGSGFYITGINFEGPAPRPLERYGIRLAEDGMLEVNKSVKFQQELGQWEDASSFVSVV